MYSIHVSVQSGVFKYQLLCLLLHITLFDRSFNEFLSWTIFSALLESFAELSELIRLGDEPKTILICLLSVKLFEFGN